MINNSKDVQRIEGGVPSSATVNIRLRDGVKPSQNLVDAAANAVAGADQIDLKNIKVLVNGASKRVHDTEDQSDGGDDHLTLLQKNENLAGTKGTRDISRHSGVRECHDETERHFRANREG